MGFHPYKSLEKLFVIVIDEAIQTTAAEFEDLQVLKSEQRTGRYYLVMGYDFRALDQRILSRLSSAFTACFWWQYCSVRSRWLTYSRILNV